jgi:hypothetical protein
MVRRTHRHPGCWSMERGVSLQFDSLGTEHLAVAVASTRVVPGLDPFEDGLGELLAALPAVFVEQLELERAEEALGHGVTEAVTDRSYGAEQAAPWSRRPKAHEV